MHIALEILTIHDNVSQNHELGKSNPFIPETDWKTYAACISILRSIKNPYTQKQYEELKEKYPGIKQKLEAVYEPAEKIIQSFVLTTENKNKKIIGIGIEGLVKAMKDGHIKRGSQLLVEIDGKKVNLEFSHLDNVYFPNWLYCKMNGEFEAIQKARIGEIDLIEGD